MDTLQRAVSQYGELLAVTNDILRQALIVIDHIQNIIQFIQQGVGGTEHTVQTAQCVFQRLDQFFRVRKIGLRIGQHFA